MVAADSDIQEHNDLKTIKMKNVERLEAIAGEIWKLNQEIANNHTKCLSPNKAAAARARKMTLALEKACKEYRKESIEVFRDEKDNTEKTDA